MKQGHWTESFERKNIKLDKVDKKFHECKRKMDQITGPNDNQPRISRLESDGIHRIDSHGVRNHQFSGGQLAFILLDI